MISGVADTRRCSLHLLSDMLYSNEIRTAFSSFFILFSILSIGIDFGERGQSGEQGSTVSPHTGEPAKLCQCRPKCVSIVLFEDYVLMHFIIAIIIHPRHQNRHLRL